jgi:hypothetical protein
MTTPLHDADLEAYLEEALPAEEMALVEKALREDRGLAQRLAAIHGRRNAGVHSVGEIWRRHRLTCPSREQLGAYLLGALTDEVSRYITFHLEVVGCRFCQANLADLTAQQDEPREAIQTRRRRYFQSSAGHLRRDKSGRA